MPVRPMTHVNTVEFVFLPIPVPSASVELATMRVITAKKVLDRKKLFKRILILFKNI